MAVRSWQFAVVSSRWQRQFAVCNNNFKSGAEHGPTRDALYFHFPHQTFQSALRAGDEKLVYGWREERAELYDLVGDPGELHDLAAERPQRAGELQSKLFRWLDAVGAARPERR